MKHCLNLFALLALLSCSKPELTNHKAIGKTAYDVAQLDEFKSWEKRGEHLVYSDEDVLYGLAHFVKGDSNMIVLEKSTDPANPERKHTVIDVLRIKQPTTDKQLVIGMCRTNKKMDTSVIAICKDDETEEILTVVIEAWRVNLKLEKFEIVDPKGIDCANLGYGISD
jgi:hypothetical protein